MKVILIGIFVLLTNSVFAKDPLEGKFFSTCDANDWEIHEGYVVEYLLNNEEFEVFVFSAIRILF